MVREEDIDAVGLDDNLLEVVETPEHLDEILLVEFVVLVLAVVAEDADLEDGEGIHITLHS